MYSSIKNKRIKIRCWFLNTDLLKVAGCAPIFLFVILENVAALITPMNWQSPIIQIPKSQNCKLIKGLISPFLRYDMNMWKLCMDLFSPHTLLLQFGAIFNHTLFLEDAVLENVKTFCRSQTKEILVQGGTLTCFLVFLISYHCQIELP